MASSPQIRDGGENSASAPALWGPEAVRALRVPRLLDAPLAGEEQLLEEVRAAVGQYASEERLRHHLRQAHGKSNWAVNGYLRESVVAHNGTRADYYPPSCPPALSGARAPESAAHSALAPECAEPAEPLELPLCLWELILSHLDAPDLRRAACVSTLLRSTSDSCWPELFARRWGVLPLNPQLQPREAYAERAASLGAFRCPACHASPLVPIVYGFPSPPLVAAQRAGVVFLAGDYLIHKDPTWACMSCHARWLTFPWAVGGMPRKVPTLAQMQAAQQDG